MFHYMCSGYQLALFCLPIVKFVLPSTPSISKRTHIIMTHMMPSQSSSRAQHLDEFLQYFGEGLYIEGAASIHIHTDMGTQNETKKAINPEPHNKSFTFNNRRKGQVRSNNIA